jgi:phage tail sheath protein FI
VHRNLSADPASPRSAAAVVGSASALVVLANISGEPKSATADPPEDKAYVFLGDATVEGGVAGTDGDAFDGDKPKSQPFNDAILGAPTATPPVPGALSELDRIDPFSFALLCLPVAARLDDAVASKLLQEVVKYCEAKRAFLLVDIPTTIDTSAKMITWIKGNDALRNRNTAAYYPCLQMPDPLTEGRLRTVGPGGTMAGLFARTDADRGVWKAPAGTAAALRGAVPAVPVTDAEQGALNQLAVNAFRTFPVFGAVCWGARTLDGADQRASEWKYIPVRRTALFIEESLVRGLKWVIFEPNDEPLWAQIRLNVGSFLNDLFRRGAFAGRSPREAYFVKCDKDTTTQADIDRGVVNVVVGFAAVEPAEFLVLQIQQIAGQLAT